MKSFLEKIAEVYIKHHKSELSNFWFVFPNRRSGQFFKKALAQEIDVPMFSPTILTITDLFVELSDLDQVDNLGLLFTLYEVYCEVKGSHESFDEFSFWGEMLLSDFDDIDKYLVDAKLLYGNLSSLKDIEAEFRRLNPEEQERLDAIKRFWQNFETKDTGKQDFLNSWNGLFDVYLQFKQRLVENKTGYQGMIFRTVVENLLIQEGEELLPKKIIFIGFNALTKAEERLFDFLKAQKKADFYWDYYQGALCEKSNRAGKFIRKNCYRFPSQYTLYSVEELMIHEDEAPMDVISVPSNIGQTRLAGTLLQDQVAPGIETAVILADEDHLIPMIQVVPSNVKTLNVTMGYPMKATPVYAFFNLLADVQNNFRMKSGEPLFHSRLVLRIINNYLVNRYTQGLDILRERIIKHNLIYLGKEEFKAYPLLKRIFQVVEDGQGVATYFQSIFAFILEKGSKTEDETTENKAVLLEDMEREYLFLIYTTVQRFGELLSTQVNTLIARDTAFRLLSRLIETQSVPFEGEPLAGLQVMGVLETRALDFKKVYIIGMNEGIFPKTSAANTYIPYNLRRGFGLPTIEDQDAIYAYYFYRLLQRAESVTLIYNSVTEGLNGGEESRYIKQLKYLYRSSISEHVQTYELSSETYHPISIKKSAVVLAKLDEFRLKGMRKFSASALNSYKDCRLKFYLGYVERLREPEEVHEDLDARLMGDVFHDAVEQFYKPIEGLDFDVALLRRRMNDNNLLERITRESFAEIFFKRSREKAEPLRGKFVIYGNVVIQYLKKVVSLDLENPPLRYIKGEEAISVPFDVHGVGKVELFGKIDRVDEVTEGLRILDYKTGAFDAALKMFSYKGMDELFERNMKDARKSLRKAIFQTFYYALLYDLNGSAKTLYPGIYYMRGLFKGIEPFIFQGKKGALERVHFKMVKDAYVDAMQELIGEIFNPEVPFDQTDELKSCIYCEFKSICGR